jgi:hypothetical protein
MKSTLTFALLALSAAGFAYAEKTPAIDCLKLQTAIKTEVSANQSLVLQIVERAVRENPTCACEIVKASIQATDADAKLIASIVEVVGVAVPEQLRLAAQCAVAVAPDALLDVQAVLAKLDPATGDGATASEKGGVDKAPVAAADDSPNPLDFPETGKAGYAGFGNNSPGFSNTPLYGTTQIIISPPKKPATPNEVRP